MLSHELSRLQSPRPQGRSERSHAARSEEPTAGCSLREPLRESPLQRPPHTCVTSTMLARGSLAARESPSVSYCMSISAREGPGGSQISMSTGTSPEVHPLTATPPVPVPVPVPVRHGPPSSSADSAAGVEIADILTGAKLIRSAYHGPPSSSADSAAGVEIADILTGAKLPKDSACEGTSYVTSSGL